VDWYPRDQRSPEAAQGRRHEIPAGRQPFEYVLSLCIGERDRLLAGAFVLRSDAGAGEQSTRRVRHHPGDGARAAREDHLLARRWRLQGRLPLGHRTTE
jgi:hypothetical protein